MILSKIISGGQTGANYGALLAAQAMGVPTGGFAPRGWRTERGPNPELRHFGLMQHPGGYVARTQANVLRSDGTLIISFNVLSPGTMTTIGCCASHGKPMLILDRASLLDDPSVILEVLDWANRHDIATLNVAGNRESVAPGIEEKVQKFLKAVLDGAKERVGQAALESMG